MLINRRQVLIGSVGAAAGLTIVPAFGQVPPLKKKDHYKVGFAQTESNNPVAPGADREHEGRGRQARLASSSIPTPPAPPPSRSPTSTA